MKTLSRSDLNVGFSHGFNPSMKLSLGVALPLFLESASELVDIELLDDISTEEFKLKLEKVLPEGCEIINIVKIDKSAKSIGVTTHWAEYEVGLFKESLHVFDSLVYNMNKVLSSDEIMLMKKNKKGLIKNINVKPSIKSYRFEDEKLFIILKTGQGEDIPALRADDLMKIISPDVLFDIRRLRFFDIEMKEI